MSLRHHLRKLRLTSTAAATGFVLATAANIVYAAPGIDPAPAPNADTSTGAASESHSSNSVSTAVSDTAITAKVKMGLLNESRVHGSNLNVTTKDGLVTLTGHTPSGDSAMAATQVAQSIKGVKGVDASQIVVASTASTASP